jgi:hypothetical protein
LEAYGGEINMEHLREGTEFRKEFMYKASKMLLNVGGLPEDHLTFFKMYIGIYEAGAIDVSKVLGL